MSNRPTRGPVSIPDHEHRFEELVRTVASLTDEELTRQFLRDLCTASELDAMAQRWEVAQLVDHGLPYSQIAELTGASTATITRVAQWLRRGEGGYRRVLDGRSS
jgi:TrpR-related protein YerC/YecD